MLAVRQTTCNDIVFLESGETNAAGYISQQQRKFMEKLTGRDSYPGSYIEWVIREAIGCRSPGGIVVKSILDQGNAIDGLQNIKNTVLASDSSRRLAYKAMNPSLSVSPVYHSSIPEYTRQSFTRMRLSSHRLAFEMGRWSRIEPENRRCPCGETQTDAHILLFCDLTADLRQKYGVRTTSLASLFGGDDILLSDVCKYCHAILNDTQFL